MDSVAETSRVSEVEILAPAQSVQAATHVSEAPNFDYIQSLPLKEIDRIMLARQGQLEAMTELVRQRDRGHGNTRRLFEEMLLLKRSYLNQKEYFRMLFVETRRKGSAEIKRITASPEIGTYYVKLTAATKEQKALRYYLQTEVIPIEKERKINKRIEELQQEINESQMLVTKYSSSGFSDLVSNNSIWVRQAQYYRTTMNQLRQSFRELIRRIKEQRSTNRPDQGQQMIRREYELVREEYRALEQRKNELLWNNLATAPPKVIRERRRRTPGRPSRERTSEDILERLIKGEEYDF